MSDTKATIHATVGILTFNSEKTLERALESVKDFAEILICDGGSTDSTREIAARCGAKVIQQDARFKNADGRLRDFGGVRQQMLESASNDWFLYIDSDETISEGLQEDIRRIAASPVRSGDSLVYRVPIRIILDGHEIKYASNYPGYQYRFFNTKSGAKFIKPVHERISFDVARVPVGVMEHPWYVYATREESKHYLRETARYRSIEVHAAMNRSFAQYLRFDVYRALRTSLGALLKSSRNYLLHGFKDSAPVQEEIGRILSPLLYIYGVTRARLGRKIATLRSPHLSEPELRVLPSLLARTPNKVFIDIGANVGAYVAVARTSLPAHKIYAVEPNTLYTEKLRAFAGVHVDTLALSSQSGTARLKVPLIKGTQYPTRGTLASVVEQDETDASYHAVPTQTLDAYVIARGAVVGVIKIDVEGHEKAVLESGETILREQHPALIVEIEQRHHTTPIADIFSWIAALGYEGYFYDAQKQQYVPLEQFAVDTHQRIEDFKTVQYVNNFVFVPSHSAAPTL